MSNSPRRPTLRDDPAWREMFARLDAKAEAARRAEANRWRGLSATEKHAEMATAVKHWRHPRRDDVAVLDLCDTLEGGGT